MARRWSGEVRVYFEQYEVGTATVSVGIKRELDALENTALGDTAERVLAGIRKDGIEWSGYFDDSTSFDAFKATNIGSATLVCSVFIGTTTGNRAYGALTRLYSESVAMANKGVVMANGSMVPDHTLDRGYVHLLRTTGTGSSSSAAVDGAAASTGTGFWYLHVFSYAGGGSSVVNLQDSADDVTYAAVGTQAVSAATAYRISVTGTIRRYTRLIWDATGTKSLASMLSRGGTANG